MSRLTVKIEECFSCGQTCGMHNVAEIEKEALQSPEVCHLVARELTSSGSILFALFIYIIQLLKKIVYIAICWAVAP